VLHNATFGRTKTMPVAQLGSNHKKNIWMSALSLLSVSNNTMYVSMCCTFPTSNDQVLCTPCC